MGLAFWALQVPDTRTKLSKEKNIHKRHNEPCLRQHVEQDFARETYYSKYRSFAAPKLDKDNSTHCNNDVPKKGSLATDLNRRPGAQENQNYKLQRGIAQEDRQTVRKTGETEREERNLT